MIQYDNVCAVAVFAESRGYLTPEEPRDFAMSLCKIFLIFPKNYSLNSKFLLIFRSSQTSKFFIYN